MLALVKGAEVALYRLLYSVHRQVTYFRSLAAGVAVIALPNVQPSRSALFGRRPQPLAAS